MSSPVEMFGTQDLKDDDGPVIDSFFKETDAPPDVTKAIEPIPVLQAPAKPEYPTRLKAGFMILTASQSPMQLVPPDPYRLFLTIRVTSLNATPDLLQYVLVGDSSTSITLPDPAARSALAYKARNGHSLSLDAHTGAIWVATNAGIQTEGIEISWISTSETK